MFFYLYIFLKNLINNYINFGVFVIKSWAGFRSFFILKFIFLVFFIIYFFYLNFNIIFSYCIFLFFSERVFLYFQNSIFSIKRNALLCFRIFFGFNLRVRLLLICQHLNFFSLFVFMLLFFNFGFYFIYFKYLIVIYSFWNLYINTILISIFSICLLYFCFSTNSVFDQFLISIHQKYFFHRFQKWILYLFRPSSKFESFFIIFWIICLCPFFLFIHYFFIPYFGMVIQFILNCYTERNFQVQSLATFDELINLLDLKRLSEECIKAFWFEYSEFFFSLPQVLGFFNFSTSCNIILNGFFLFLMLCGLKLFKLQQSIFYSYLQFNFNKMIYYFIILKIFFFLFYSFFTILIILSKSEFYYFFEYLFQTFDDFINFYCIGFFIDFYEIFIFYKNLLLLLNIDLFWYIPLICLYFSEAFIFLCLNFINNCILYFMFLVSFFFELQHSILFFWEFFSCVILFFIFYFLLLNPQSLIKYYEIDFVKYYHRAYQKLGAYFEDRREVRELADQANFKIGAVCDPMVKEFPFRDKSFHFIEKNLSYYYDISIMYATYESIYYFFKISAYKNSRRYIKLKFDYSKLFNPFVVFFLLYIPFSYMRLPIVKRLVKQAVWADFNARNQIIQDIKHFESEFVLRWVALLHRFSRKISPIQYKQWVNFYDIKELTKRHPGLLDIFYLHRLNKCFV